MSTSPEPFLRSLIAGAGTVTLIGIALAASEQQEIGGWLTLLGLVGLIYSLHRYGRSGPDAPLDFSGSTEAPSDGNDE